MNRGNRSYSRSQRALAGSRRGFTLIEILVVLVILLIGILALLRLFPSGFLTIQRTGELTSAEALAQQQLDALRNLPAPPEEVGAALPDVNGNIQQIPAVGPDNLTDSSPAELANVAATYNFTLPANYSPYYYSDINRIRYIKGELFKIPVATPNSASAAFGAIYTLQYGPVYNVFHTDASGNTIDSLHVNGVPLTGIQQDMSQNNLNNSNPAGNIQNDSQYAIDYGNPAGGVFPLIAFFPRITDPGYNVNYRLFTFKYQAYQPNNGQQTLTDIVLTIKVPDVAAPTPGTTIQPIPQQIFDPNLTTVVSPANMTPGQLQIYPIIPGTEQVSRQFRLVTSTTVTSTNPATPPSPPTWSKDPYEYAWYSPQETGNANRGVLIFNPHGHVSFPDPNASDVEAQNFINQQTISARIDYLTFDNHIIRDDRSMPAGAPYRVKLSLPFILGQGDILPNQYNYMGIYTDPTIDNSKLAGGDTADVTVVNMNTGQKLCDIVSGVSVNGSLLQATLDPKSGTISFTQTLNGGASNNGKGVEDLNLQNAAIRVYYRAQKDFGMQVQKAAAQYTAVPSVANLTSSTYYIGGGQDGGVATRIYFAVSEAGKTVNIGELYYATGNSNTSVPDSFPRATNQTFQINDTAANFTTLNGVTVTYIDITSTFPNALGLSAIPTGRAVNYVQGASLKSRVIWSDSGRAVNNTPPNNGTPTGRPYWRKVDNDTVVQSNNQ